MAKDWGRRVDNYDPHIDQEVAYEILNHSRR